MASDQQPSAQQFVAGVIEGFYGPPWTWHERRSMADSIALWGGNWYVWAPKADPHHRDAWSEPFSADEVDGFASLIDRGIGISIGLTPGADATPDDVVSKLASVAHVAHGFTICFDDLDDHDQFTRHAAITNRVRDEFGLETWLVPTHYAGLSTSPYLSGLVSELHEDIAVMWTGRTVVCDSITTEEASSRSLSVGGRPPLIWDNTPVNDAMMRDLLHLGPYQGRDGGLRDVIAGVLVNPMEFASASRPTIRSAMAWANGRDHVAEWADEVESLGLRALAEATSFPGDIHWPGDTPDRDWWRTIAAMPTIDDERLERWAEAAREGAKAALALLDVDGSASDPGSVGRVLNAIITWRAWSRREVSTFGRGPRMRPVFGQGESGRFHFEPGTIGDSTSLVDRLVTRVLG